MPPVAVRRYRYPVSWAYAFSLAIVAAAPAGERVGPEEPVTSEVLSLSKDAVGPEGPVPAWELWQDYVRIKRPKGRGTGLMIAAGAAYGVGIFAQLTDIAFNEGQGSGYVDRLFLGTSMVLAPVGAFLRGRDDAFVDAAVGRRKRPANVMIGVGLAMAGIGAIAGLANEGMWWQCRLSETGPYYVEPPPDVFVPDSVCRSGLARLALDGSALMFGGGLAMGLWGLKYRRDSKKYERAVISVVPRMQRSQVGFGIVGSF